SGERLSKCKSGLSSIETRPAAMVNFPLSGSMAALRRIYVSTEAPVGASKRNSGGVSSVGCVAGSAARWLQGTKPPTTAANPSAQGSRRRGLCAIGDSQYQAAHNLPTTGKPTQANRRALIGYNTPAAMKATAQNTVTAVIEAALQRTLRRAIAAMPANAPTP